MNSLNDTHLREPAQFLALDEDRLFVRLQGAQFLLRGTGLEDLTRLFPFLNGAYATDAIVDALRHDYPVQGIRRTLEVLLGRQLGQVPTPPALKPTCKPTGSLRIGCIAHEKLAAAIASQWPASYQLQWAKPPTDPTPTNQRFRSFPPETIPAQAQEIPRHLFQTCDLVLWVAEQVSFEFILQMEQLARQEHVGLLLGFATPIGFEWLPLFGPNHPCFSCTQASEFGTMLGNLPLFPTIAPLRTVPILRNHYSFVAQLLAQKIADIEANKTEIVLPQRFNFRTGTLNERSIKPQPQCALCQTGPPLKKHASTPLSLFDENHQVRSRSIQTVGIVGGGTAGYLSALALRAKHPDLQVTLIESPHVPVIGVGEATTPLMLQFLHVDLGIDMVEFFQKVHPTLKFGIYFDWGKPAPWSFPYPFGPMETIAAHTYDQHLNHFSQTASHMSAGTVPLQQSNGNWITDWDCYTAYHLDNRKFVHFLQETALARGVVHKTAHIRAVHATRDGNRIRSLETENGELLSFDVFLDCTGFQALLLQELQTPFVSFSKTLFTDSALIGKIPDPGFTPPFTRATTMSAGWCWNTPQRDAHHCGYVYAASYIEPAEAEAEMRQFLPQLGPVIPIAFRTGRHRDFFAGNVVALGNAYGFVEPLESTALHMLIRQIGWFVQTLPNGPADVASLNQKVASHWDYLAWFLGLHYRFNKRMNTPFWKHCQKEVDLSRFQHLLEAFQKHGPLVHQPALWQELQIPDPLWGPEGVDLMLLAQGIDTPKLRSSIARKAWQVQKTQRANFAETALHQAEALKIMDRHPDLIARLATCFKNRGPAFG